MAFRGNVSMKLIGGMAFGKGRGLQHDQTVLPGRDTRSITMKIIISAIVAYLVLGFSHSMKDLGESAANKPPWARNPSFLTFLSVSLSWCLGPYLEMRWSGHSLGRSISYGILQVCIRLALITGFVWLCISGATCIFDNLVFQILASILFLLVGTFIVLPVAGLLVIPIMIPFAFAIDVIFPLKPNR